MEENKENMSLTDDEKKSVKEYQLEIKNIMTTIGSNRRQALRLEQELMNKINNLENEFFNYLNVLAKSHGKQDGENWIFDPNNYEFVKKE